MRIRLAIAALLLLGAPAAAQSPIPEKPGAQTCLARTYDAAHLRSHPQQKVARVALGLRFNRTPRADQVEAYHFTLALRLKSGGRGLRTSGYCDPLAPLDPALLATLTADQREALEDERKAVRNTAGALQCIVDCDGGGVLLERTSDGKGLLMHLDRIRMSASCDGDEGGVEVEGGVDDKLFRLDPAPASVCSAR